MSKLEVTAEVSRPSRIPMFKVGQALESLREAGHSLPTALAEVIDNSIEANANRVWLELQEGKNERGRKCVHRIAVGDDGEGMDEYVLHHYLEIGFSTRWMRQDTIGKFGVGAKFAALNFARRIDVWSRQTEADLWRHVYFDLDEAREQEQQGQEPGIEAPTVEAPPDDLVHLLPGKTGTLVVWSNVDRLEHGRVASTFDELLVEVQKELSRIFRYFVNGGIQIKVNETALLAHDPLLLMENTWTDHVLTKFYVKEDDATRRKGAVKHYGAILIADEPIKVKGSNARLRVTLYPPEVTRKRGVGGDKLSTKLRVPENLGCISFVRMNREVSYTNVPRIFPRGVQDADRFIGIEVSFRPDLDDFFGIRNVKRGVEPHGELRDKIRGLLRKHIKTARDLLEDAWGRVAKEEREHEGEYAAIVEAVKEADLTMPKGRVTGPTSEDEAARILEDLARDTGHADTEEGKRAYLERIKGLPFVLESVDFPGNMFIDIKHLNGKVLIRVNTRHKFYRELWEPLIEIAQRNPGSVSGEEAVKAARRATEGLALMVIAYGKAQSMEADPQIYDNLTMYWGQFLDTLMGKVKGVV